MTDTLSRLAEQFEELFGPTKGTRVVALSHMDDEAAYIYGYGTYEGSEPCEALKGTKNPRIKLDDGSYVWGYQCWWGDVAHMEKMLGKRQIITLKKE